MLTLTTSNNYKNKWENGKLNIMKENNSGERKCLIT